MYPSDLTDAQWARLEVLLQAPVGNRHAGGRPRKYPLRRLTEAVLYVVKTGLSVAADAGRFSSLANGLSTVSGLADARCLGTGNQVIAGAGPQGSRTPRPQWRSSTRSRPKRR
jgi:hypothetical protein